MNFIIEYQLHLIVFEYFIDYFKHELMHKIQALLVKDLFFIGLIEKKILLFHFNRFDIL
jgi:hypothetical protein